MPSATESLADPPNNPMISKAVMAQFATLAVANRQGGAINSVVARFAGEGQALGVLNRTELLALLNEKVEAKKIKNADIARVLGLPSSRIPGLLRGERRIYFDEAVKLVEAFELEPAQLGAFLPHSVYRLVAAHVAECVGAEPGDELLDELAADLGAFSRFAADPQVRESIEQTETFLRAVRMRRQSEPANLSKIDRQTA